jgi:hypothetical protein
MRTIQPLLGALLFLSATTASAETYRGMDATVRACLIPMKTLKGQLRAGQLEAGGLPATILRTRLYFNRMRHGPDKPGLGAKLQAALNRPVGSVMTSMASPTQPVYVSKPSRYGRPSTASAVKDLTTSLVTSLRAAPNTKVRRALLAGAKLGGGFDRGALGRLLRAHRGAKPGGSPIVFSTDAYKPQARNGDGVLVASGGQDVYMFIDHPKALLKKGAISFTLAGGQPRTANMGITAGSAVSFTLDRRGTLKGVDVVGRGDLLLKSLSGQLLRDIVAGARTGSKADPRDLLALVNHAAPTLLKRMIDRPKEAVLFSPMKGWVPFAPER